MQRFVEQADVVEDVAPEEHRLLQDVIRHVNEFPEIERLGHREALLDVTVDVDLIAFAVHRAEFGLA